MIAAVWRSSGECIVRASESRFVCPGPWAFDSLNDAATAARRHQPELEVVVVPELEVVVVLWFVELVILPPLGLTR